MTATTSSSGANDGDGHQGTSAAAAAPDANAASAASASEAAASAAAAAAAAVSASEDLRQRGNYEFSNRRYDVASQLYSQALQGLRSRLIDGAICTVDDADGVGEAGGGVGNNENAAAAGTVDNGEDQQAQQQQQAEADRMKNEIVLNLCNRSACYYQMREYGDAKNDALVAYRMSSPTAPLEEAVDDGAEGSTPPPAAAALQSPKDQQKQRKHNRLKSGFRLAKTHMALDEYGEAKRVIQDSLKLLDAADEAGRGAEGKEKPAVPPPSEGDGEDGSKKEKQEQKQQPPNLAQHRKAFEDLWKQVLEKAYAETDDGKTTTKPKQKEEEQLTTVRNVQRPMSIKEFDTKLGREMGYGNFSEIVVVRHRQTRELFALKIIEKKKAADLAKRQHPNVYNEIHMERRVLLERLPRHYNVVEMYASFQDYYSLYYLMELHDAWGDLWSEMKYYPLVNSTNSTSTTSTKSKSPQLKQSKKYVMTGCHRSQTKVWMAQLLSAIEHMHKHGIVHRDLKPENILLNKRGHVVVIDFGTAKDLIETDLNGPEFVGTPDFMCPEAVKGTSGMKEAGDAVKEGKVGATHEADLWSFGAILYLLQTGMTPFWSPSTYLAMMRIKRGSLKSRGRPTGIVDDDAWDLCLRLMQVDPSKRLGSDAFELVVPDKSGGKRRIETKPGGYDSSIRQHPYFADVFNNNDDNDNPTEEEENQGGDNDNDDVGDFDPVMKKKTPIPTLRDLCYPAVAEWAHIVSQDVELCDKYPPGCGNKRYDFMMLGGRDRDCVMHVLDRMKLLRDPRVYGLFFTSLVEARITSKVRCRTHDFVGMTQMNDDMGKPPKATMNDQYATPVSIGDGTIGLVHLTNPLFAKSTNESASDDDRKRYVKLLKKCIGTINRNRPKLVVACGYIDDKCKKLLARINETIPVVVHDSTSTGNAFFTFWLLGVQCIAVRQSQSNEDEKKDSEQNVWLREQLEQVRMSKHPLFVFADTDPRKLPLTMLKRLARGRTLAIYGITEEEEPYNDAISYGPNELVGDDNVSIKSDDSDDEDDKDAFTMKVRATRANGLRYIAVDEEVPDSWNETFEEVNL